MSFTPVTDTSKRTRPSVPFEDILYRLKERSEWDEITLTPEHAAVMDSIFTWKANVFLTGGAGTGKTTFVKHFLIPELAAQGINFHVTASTGIAGSHLDGRTLHSFLGIGLGVDWPRGNDVTLLSPDFRQAFFTTTYNMWLNNPRTSPAARYGVLSRLRACQVLLIDEISMIGGKGLLDYVDFFLQQVRGNNQPFGGIQMIFIGDFLQLPPVEKDKQPGATPDWAFLSDSWRRANVIPMELSVVYRQTDSRFVSLLNHIRRGCPVTEDDMDFLRPYIHQPSELERKTFSFLMPTNDEVNQRNDEIVDNAPGKLVKSAAIFHIRQEHLRDYDTMERMKKRLLEKSRFSPELRLKVGIPVMLTVNEASGLYFNGTKGFVEQFDLDEQSGRPRGIYVRIPDRTSKEPGATMLLRVTPRLMTLGAQDDPGEKIFIYDRVDEDGNPAPPGDVYKYPVVEQFPLIPASAITIHKCVAHDTLVPTTSGLMEIQSVCDLVGSGIEVSGMEGFKPVSDLYDGVVELGYRITTRRGFSLVCSERHPLMKVNNDGETWSLAPTLKVGDLLRMKSSTLAQGNGQFPAGFTKRKHQAATKDYTLPLEMSNDLAWLLGALIGDGCVTDHRDGRLDVTSMDEDILIAFERIMKDLFSLTAVRGGKPDSRATVCYVHSKGVRDFFTHLGVPYNKALTKHIPRAIFRGTLSHQAAFLRGLFDTDGGVNNCMHFTTASPRLAAEVQILLANLGIIASKVPMKNAWRLTISGVDGIRFRDEVNFTIPYKQDACSRVTRRSESRKLPKVMLGFYPAAYGMRLIEAVREELLRAFPSKKIGLHFGAPTWSQFFTRVLRGNCRFSDAHWVAFAREFPDYASYGPACQGLCDAAVAGAFIDEIVAIEREEVKMMDITVPDGHAFIGNVFLNHNSQGSSLEDVVISMDRSFAPGQVYVALSRLRSHEKMIITSPELPVFAEPWAVHYHYYEVRAHTYPLGEPLSQQAKDDIAAEKKRLATEKEAAAEAKRAQEAGELPDGVIDMQAWKNRDQVTPADVEFYREISAELERKGYPDPRRSHVGVFSRYEGAADDLAEAFGLPPTLIEPPPASHFDSLADQMAEENAKRKDLKVDTSVLGRALDLSLQEFIDSGARAREGTKDELEDEDIDF